MEKTTRSIIIATAESLFLAKGYQETTMQDIMNHTGLSKGAIYHYFDSKDKILDAVSDKRRERVLGEIDRMVDDNNKEGIQQRLMRVINTVITAPIVNFENTRRWFKNVPFAYLQETEFYMHVIADRLKLMMKDLTQSYSEEKAESVTVAMYTFVRSAFNCVSPKQVMTKFEYLAYQLRNIDQTVFNDGILSKLTETFSNYVNENEGAFSHE